MKGELIETRHDGFPETFLRGKRLRYRVSVGADLLGAGHSRFVKLSLIVV